MGVSGDQRRGFRMLKVSVSVSEPLAGTVTGIDSAPTITVAVRSTSEAFSTVTSTCTVASSSFTIGVLI